MNGHSMIYVVSGHIKLGRDKFRRSFNPNCLIRHRTIAVNPALPCQPMIGWSVGRHRVESMVDWIHVINIKDTLSYEKTCKHSLVNKMRAALGPRQWRRLPRSPPLPLTSSLKKKLRLPRLPSKRLLLRLVVVIVLIAFVPPMRMRKCHWLESPPLVCAHGGDSSRAAPNTKI
ncbi:hypothetical protein IEQ34_011082 [Dendrobium chrysotoxum]|uniref:Uncharacterized protein n=1 Tax=Dendrobium chrysotoxum TaxID=161865 RepID=A0AAV7GX98_DENCH|nr:hypothetical protein IEQ34_011082 [Dendrobium chrysotoxum]